MNKVERQKAAAFIGAVIFTVLNHANADGNKLFEHIAEALGERDSNIVKDAKVMAGKIGKEDVARIMTMLLEKGHFDGK